MMNKISQEDLKILEKSFTHIAEGQYGGKYVCVIPSIFTTDYVGTKRLIPAFLKASKNPKKYTRSKKRDMFELNPIQGVGETKFESQKDLLLKLTYGGMRVMRHKPQLKDKFKPVIGQLYVAVYEEEPFHKHGSTEMIDFSQIMLNPYQGIFEEEETFGEFHSHFIPVDAFKAEYC